MIPWVSESVSQLGVKMRMKASIPILHWNTNALYDFQYVDALSAETVHLKKPSGGPKGPNRFPMPWGRAPMPWG